MSVVSKLQIVLEATTTAFDRGLRSAQRSLDDFARRTQDLHERIDRFARNNEEALQGLQTAGAAAAVGLGVIAVGIHGAVQEAMRFEDAMADVKKVIDFDSPQGIKDFRAELEKMSGQLPIAFDGLAKIAAAAGQSGIAKEDILRFTEAAAKMGVAFDISADEAGQAMAEMRLAFKMNQSEVETLADKINFLGNTTPNTAKKILEVVQRIGTLGGIAGVSSDQITALAGSITAVEPDVAATGIQNMILAMTAGEGATKSQKEAFDSLGLSAEKLAKNMQVDSMGTFLDLLERIKKMPKELQVATINDIFGSEALPIIAQYVDNLDVLKNNLKAMGDASKYAGSMNAEYDSRAATLSNTLAILSNKIQIAKASIGEAFAPSVGELANKIAPIVDKIATWAKENPILITTITAVTAGVLGLVTVLGGLALAFTAVTSGLGAIIAIGGMISGFFAAISSGVGLIGMFGAALAGLGFPITAVVAGITALVVAGVALYKNWDDIEAKAVQVFNSLPAPVQEAVNNIRGLFESLVSFISSAMETLAPIFTTAWSGIKTVVTAQLTLISTAFGVWWEATKTIFTAGIGAVRAIITAGVTVFASVFNVGFNTIKAVITTALGVIKGIVTGDMGAVKQAFHNGMTQAWGAVKSGVSNILSAFSGLGSQLFSIGSSAVEGLISGIRAKLQPALDTMRNLAKQVVSTAKQAFDINSPAKTMIPVGESVAEGVEVGIKKGTPKSQAAAKKLAQKTAKEASKALKDLEDNFKSQLGEWERSHWGMGTPFVSELSKTEFEITSTSGKFHIASEAMQNDLRKLAREMDTAKANFDLFGTYTDATRQIKLLSSKGSQYQAMAYDLQDTGNPLHLAGGEQKKQILTTMADLEVATKAWGIQDKILENQKELIALGTPDGMARELLLIEQERADTLEKYNYLLKDGYTEQFALVEQQANTLAEQQKQTVITKQYNDLVQSLKTEEEKRLDTLQSQLDVLLAHQQVMGASLDIERAKQLISQSAGLATPANAHDKLNGATANRFTMLDAGLQSLLDNERLTEQERIDIKQWGADERLKIERTHTQAMNALVLSDSQNMFGSLASIAKDGLGEQSRLYRAMFAMQQGFAIAQAGIAMQQAISQGLSKGFPAGLADMALAAAEGAKIISAIKSVVVPVGQAHDGIMSVPKSGTWNLEKGERVLPKHTAQNLDNTLNRLQGGGGQVINVNVTVNSDGGDVQSSHDMGKNLGNAIKLAVQAELQKERRQGGMLYGR